MTWQLSNQSAGVNLAAAITSTATTVTRASDATGWPGDSNGDPAGPFVIVVTDGTNYEEMLVTGGFGTTSLTVVRAFEKVSGDQTAYAFTTAATMTPSATRAMLQDSAAAAAAKIAAYNLFR